MMRFFLIALDDADLSKAAVFGTAIGIVHLSITTASLSRATEDLSNTAASLSKAAGI